jgi:hypothetical protein
VLAAQPNATAHELATIQIRKPLEHRSIAAAVRRGSPDDKTNKLRVTGMTWLL